MRSIIRETIESISLALLVFLLLRTSMQVYGVHGPSMEPQLVEHDLVVVNKVVYLSVDAQRASRFLPWVNAAQGEEWSPFHPPRQGEVVVLHNPFPPGPDLVKRMIAGPGDTVELVQGVVFVNGKRLDEPYIKYPSRDGYGPVVIGPNRYFVLGDNRIRSEDSRFFGMVPREQIVGKVWLGYWPLDRFGFLLATP